MSARHKQRLISDRVHLRHHLTDEIVLMRDGGLFTMIEVGGLAWETSSIEDVVRDHLQLNNLYRNIAHERVVIHSYGCRTWGDLDEVYPRRRFANPVAQSMDDAFRDKLSNNLFDNTAYIGIEVGPVSRNKFRSESSRQFKRAAEEASEAYLDLIDSTRRLLLNGLAKYAPRQLGTIETPDGHVRSEIAEALVFALTGYRRQVPLTTGALSGSMFSEYINAGHKISRTIIYEAPGATWYGAIFGLQKYMRNSYPGMFDRLLAVPYRYTLYQSFGFMQTTKAQDELRTRGVAYRSAKDAAASLASELGDVADELASGDSIVMGDHCLSFLVFANTLPQLREVATAAWGDLSLSGAKIAREPVPEPALFSMLPGNLAERPRPAYVSSLNMTSFVPHHAYATGETSGHWDDPIAVFRTISGEAYLFFLHIDDVGNVFVTGRIGSGKTMFLGGSFSRLVVSVPRSCCGTKIAASKFWSRASAVCTSNSRHRPDWRRSRR